MHILPVGVADTYTYEVLKSEVSDELVEELLIELRVVAVATKGPVSATIPSFARIEIHTSIL